MTKRTIKTTKTKTNEFVRAPVVVSTGCPRGIGPEVSVTAAYKLKNTVSTVLVGHRPVLEAAARLRKVPARFISNAPPFDPAAYLQPGAPLLSIVDPGPTLSSDERRLGRPQAEDGVAQL